MRVVHNDWPVEEPTDDRRWLVQEWPDEWCLSAIAAVLALDETAGSTASDWVRLFDSADRVLRLVLPI